MRAFVTGGSGFVGRNLIRQLRGRGDSVVALVRSADSARVVEALGAVPAMGDLDDLAAMQKGMVDCDTVFHCAAEVAEWGPRERYHRVNVDGTRRALEAARAAGVTCFVHVGTEAALCNGAKLLDVDETRPLPDDPLPRYPQTKNEAERLVRAANAPGLRTVVVRPRFIWGNDDTSVLTALAAAVKAGRFMWMDGGRYPTARNPHRRVPVRRAGDGERCQGTARAGVRRQGFAGAGVGFLAQSRSRLKALLQQSVQVRSPSGQMRPRQVFPRLHLLQP